MTSQAKPHAEITQADKELATSIVSGVRGSAPVRLTDVVAQLLADYRAELERKARLDEANEMPHDSACREGEWNPLTRDTNNCDCYKSRRIAELEREGQ